jgi:hypothetical protein
MIIFSEDNELFFTFSRGPDDEHTSGEIVVAGIKQTVLSATNGSYRHYIGEIRDAILLVEA